MLPVAVRAQDQTERTEFGQDIILEASQELKEAVCVGCSFHVHGSLDGDAVAIGGRIEVDGNVAGDIVAIGGGARLGANAKVAGDVVAFGGQLDRDPHAAVAGGPWVAVLLGAALLTVVQARVTSHPSESAPTRPAAQSSGAAPRPVPDRQLECGLRAQGLPGPDFLLSEGLASSSYCSEGSSGRRSVESSQPMSVAAGVSPM